MLDLESEVQWFNTRVTEIFCFHEIKSLIPILALLPFLCISKKNSIICPDFHSKRKDDQTSKQSG